MNSSERGNNIVHFQRNVYVFKYEMYYIIIVFKVYKERDKSENKGVERRRFRLHNYTPQILFFHYS